MTNPGDYIWNPGYGAGLGQFVGKSVDLAALQALIRTQMGMEPAVSVAPDPVILASADVAGRLYLQIRYEDSSTATASTVSVSAPI
ncbi:MAG: hypothetical protein RQ966_18060 [Acetobacteraceae bacterium]|nr:hypothetical protein [Acetobacteraceae bacterium]